MSSAKSTALWSRLRQRFIVNTHATLPGLQKTSGFISRSITIRGKRCTVPERLQISASSTVSLHRSDSTWKTKRPATGQNLRSRASSIILTFQTISSLKDRLSAREDKKHQPQICLNENGQ